MLKNSLKKIAYDNIVKKLLKIVTLLVLLFVAGVCGLFLKMGYASYKEAVRRVSIENAVRPYMERTDFVDYDDISPYFVNAVVSVEDQRFFQRYGFDWLALTRAIFNNLKAGAFIEGGSTISQQIAKNLYYPDVHRGIREKIAEVYLMNDLEAKYTKKELFALYVNMNYYGDGYWGIGQAAKGYFHTTPDALSIAQAAILAGIPNAPGIYQLSTGYDRAISRMKKVLVRMVKTRCITQQQAQDALNEELDRPAVGYTLIKRTGFSWA